MKSLKNLLQNFVKSSLFSRLIQILLVILLMVATIYLTGPLPEKDAQGEIIPSATPTLAVGSQTNEIFEKTPTTGVIVAGFGVIAIILGGSAIALRRQK